MYDTSVNCMYESCNPSKPFRQQVRPKVQSGLETKVIHKAMEERLPGWSSQKSEIIDHE